MAIYEKNEGRQMIKNSRYFKGDYVAFGVLRTLIATTFAYIIMVILLSLIHILEDESCGVLLTSHITSELERNTDYSAFMENGQFSGWTESIDGILRQDDREQEALCIE